MENANTARQRKTACLTANLLQMVRQHEWGEDVRVQAAQAIQDNLLAGMSSATQIELKTGQMLTLQYDYPGMPNGFVVQISYDEDRNISLGDSGAKACYISKRGQIIKHVDLSKGDYAIEQSARISSFLND